MEGEKRGCVSAGGLCRTHSCCSPAEWMGLGLRHCFLLFYHHRLSYGHCPFSPHWAGLETLRLLLSCFFSHLMHRITLMGLNGSSQAMRGKNNKLLNVRQNYGPLLFRVSLVDLGPLCSIVPAALSIGAGETQVGNFIAEHVQGKAGSERFRSETAAVGERGLFLLGGW